MKETEVTFRINSIENYFGLFDINTITIKNKFAIIMGYYGTQHYAWSDTQLNSIFLSLYLFIRSQHKDTKRAKMESRIKHSQRFLATLT